MGGVILDLDIFKSYQAFSKLCRYRADELQARASSQLFFNEYEKGWMTDTEFRTALRSFLNCQATDQQLDEAWNAMLLRIPKEKYALLQKLKDSHQLFLLSNTNNIHLQAVNQIVFNDTGDSNLSNYFHKEYYSHLMKMRKPDSEIFQCVLTENDLATSETLFLDDNLENILSASSLGIRTTHITSPEMVLPLFA